MNKTLIEALHIAAGLAATIAIASVCSWSYPPAGETIWWVAGVAAVIVAFMGVHPLRTAWRADHDARRGND